jgi:hypothetical protein
MRNPFSRPEPRNPLPAGVKEFHEWAERIMEKTGLSATVESQKFALAGIILSLKENVGYVEDSYFVNCLRRSASEQVVRQVANDIRDRVKAKKPEEEKQKQAEVTPPTSQGAEVLEIKRV